MKYSIRRSILLCVLLLGIQTGWAAEGLMADVFWITDVSNLAMGGYNMGTANIWNDKASSILPNPALPAYIEGLSITYNHDYVFAGVNHDISLMSYGINGITLTAPLINGSGRFGAGVSLSSDYYEMVQPFGIAVDVPRVLKQRGYNMPFAEYINTAIGTSVYRLESSMDWTDENYITKHYNEAGHCINIGGIIKWHFPIAVDVTADGAIGVTKYNLTKSNMKWGTVNGRIYDGVMTGVAMGVEWAPPSAVQLFNFMNPDYLLAARYQYNELNDDLSYVDTENKGDGAEFGLLDTFFYRVGRQDDYYGNTPTHGIGVKLHYKKLVTFSYDWMRFDQTENEDSNIDHTRESYSLNMDVLSLIQKLK